MGKEFEIYYWTPVDSWNDYWQCDDWNEALAKLKEAKEQYVYVKFEWRKL